MAQVQDSLTVGALCSGYGGIELGIAQVLDVELAWYSEIDHYAKRVMAHHHPGVENTGDVKGSATLEAAPVDWLTGGYPCQPFSHAGRRLGAEDERHLWPAILAKVTRDRPRFVTFENVRGHVTMGLLDVIRDLTGLGYTVHYYVFPAAAVGACHRRERVFIFGTTDQVHLPRPGRKTLVRQGAGYRHLDTGKPAKKPFRNGVAWGMFITEGNPAVCDDLPDSLLPTPAVNDMGAGKTVEAWDAWTERMRGEFGNGNGHGKSLSIEVLRLLPTPVATDAAASARHTTTTGNSHSGTSLTDAMRLLPTPEAKLGRSGPDFARPGREGSGGHDLATAVHLLPTPTTRDHKGRNQRDDATCLPGAVEDERWGMYAAAVARHEEVLGGPAPDPTVPAPKGGLRLNPVFVEWMMNLPAGHVTAPEIWEGATNARGVVLKGERGAGTVRSAQLKMLGNGVVPAQAAAATRAWLRDCRRVASATAVSGVS